jgi:hypothetical protein
MPGATFNMPDAFAAFGVRVANGAMTAGGSNPRILTSATAAFSAFDVGKKITVAGAGAAGADLTTKIARRLSATQVELKDPALTTVVGANVSYVKGVYRLSALLSGADVDGNTYQFLGQLRRLQIGITDSPGGVVFIGGPYVTSSNFGVKLAANQSDNFTPGSMAIATASSEYVASDTANQKLRVYWNDDLNQSVQA